MNFAKRWTCTAPLPFIVASALISASSLGHAADDGTWNSLRKQINEFGVDGSLRGSYWSSNKLLDDEDGVANAMLWLRAQRPLGENVSIYASGHFGIEGVGEYNKDRNRLREAYLDTRFKNIDLRIGKQIIAWGRADRLNPTDNLTPRDFTLLVPEEDDNRFGTIALRGNVALGANLGLQAVWLPEFRPYKYPVPVPAGVSVERDIPDNEQGFGIKLEQSGKRVDWSVSFYTGMDLVPDWGLKDSALPSVIAQSTHHRIQVLGVDGATTAGAFGIRWELAYTRTKDRDGDDPEIKNPFFYGVVGVERTFMENLNVNVQIYGRKVQDYTDPATLTSPVPLPPGLLEQIRSVAKQSAISSNQSRETEYGVTTRIGKKWWNDTLEAELAVMYNIKPEGYFIRPKVIYAFTDHFKGTLGAEYYGGDDDSFFGNIRANKAVFAELSYWF